MYPTNSSSSMYTSNGGAGGYPNSNNMSMGNQVLQQNQTQQQHQNMPGMSSPHDSDAAMASAAAQLEQVSC